jgi:hypothetical protein
MVIPRILTDHRRRDSAMPIPRLFMKSKKRTLRRIPEPVLCLDRAKAGSDDVENLCAAMRFSANLRRAAHRMSWTQKL